MNISQTESPFILEAKTCGCQNKKNIAYSFVESIHNLCIDRRDIIMAQILACERLMKYTMDDNEIKVIEKEIAELKLAKDLISY
jgi:hypothetical protein